MLRLLFILTSIASKFVLHAQPEKNTANWKPWFITSVKEYRLTAPASYKQEIAQVLAAQKDLDETAKRQILYWNANSPIYRWQEIMSTLWMSDSNGVLANMLLGTAIYDATLAAWDTKFTFSRPRPFAVDPRIKCLIPKPETPAYPCEYSVAAGAAVAVIAHYYPKLADSMNRMAQRMMTSRVAAGVVFPSDTKAGFELGKKIAMHEINFTRNFLNRGPYDGVRPTGPGYYTAQFAVTPESAKNKTVVLARPDQFRPPPPPDFTKEMAELKNAKQTFRSRSNAFYWANEDFWSDYLYKRIMEYNMNALQAARMIALAKVAMYDAVTACWDAKYAYWGIRPDQMDTTYKALIPTPPFPGYPSGHAVVSGTMSQLYAYFFPEDRAMLEKKAKDAAESRFQGGIHFRTDNEVGLDLGRKVAGEFIQRAKQDRSGMTQ